MQTSNAPNFIKNNFNHLDENGRVRSDVHPKKNELFNACQDGDLVKVHRLCQIRPDFFEARDYEEWNILHFASFNGRGDLVQDLIQHRPNLVNSVEEDGQTPLFTALLGAMLVGLHGVEKRSPLRCDMKGFRKTVQVLVENGVEVDLKDKSGSTAISFASKQATRHSMAVPLDAEIITCLRKSSNENFEQIQKKAFDERKESSVNEAIFKQVSVEEYEQAQLKQYNLIQSFLESNPSLQGLIEESDSSGDYSDDEEYVQIVVQAMELFGKSVKKYRCFDKLLYRAATAIYQLREERTGFAQMTKSKFGVTLNEDAVKRIQEADSIARLVLFEFSTDIDLRGRKEVNCTCEAISQLIKRTPTLLYECDEDGWSALHAGCYIGASHQVLVLIELGAEVQAIEESSKHTPLHLAVLGLTGSGTIAKHAHAKVISALLENGAQIMNNEKGASPISFLEAAIKERSSNYDRGLVLKVLKQLRAQLQKQSTKCANFVHCKHKPNAGLTKCPTCGVVWYCSEQCKQQHSAFHRKMCHPSIIGVGLPETSINPINGRMRFF